MPVFVASAGQAAADYILVESRQDEPEDATETREPTLVSQYAGVSAQPQQAQGNPECVPGEYVLENGHSYPVEVRVGAEGILAKTADYNQIVRFSQGSMAGKRAYFKKRDVQHPRIIIRG